MAARGIPLLPVHSKGRGVKRRGSEILRWAIFLILGAFLLYIAFTLLRKPIGLSPKTQSTFTKNTYSASSWHQERSAAKQKRKATTRIAEESDNAGDVSSAERVKKVFHQNEESEKLSPTIQLAQLNQKAASTVLDAEKIAEIEKSVRSLGEVKAPLLNPPDGIKLPNLDATAIPSLTQPLSHNDTDRNTHLELQNVTGAIMTSDGSPHVPLQVGSIQSPNLSKVEVMPVTEPDKLVNSKQDAPLLLKPTGLYSMTAIDIDGNEQSLSKYAGNVSIVVNVASACGYTDTNYKGLTKAYEKYHKFGFEVLGFPCNQFGNQESGDEKSIKEFCSSKYNVNFPMFSKVEVNGPNTHPIYRFLKRELPTSEGGGGGVGEGKDLVWNFQKILVNRQGQPVRLFYHNYDAGEVELAVYQLLHE